MNLNDFSIDLETLGVDFDAPVIAIGAVAFDRTTGKTGPTFYEEVQLTSAIKTGRVDGATIAWWINQSPRAKMIFARPDSEKKALSNVLYDFMSWLRTVGKGTPQVWAKGPAEDITWLKHALVHGSVGLYPAWGHSNVYDLRTIILLAQELAGFEQTSVPQVGTAHNALDDAIYQAHVVCAAYKSLDSKGLFAKKPGKTVKTVSAAPADDEL